MKKLLILIILNCVAIIFYKMFGGYLMESIYNKKAPLFLNDLIHWRDYFPLKFYMREMDFFGVIILVTANFLFFCVAWQDKLKTIILKFRYVICVVATVLPIGWIIYLVARYTIKVPLQDMWDFFTSTYLFLEHQLRWSDLIAWHGPHRGLLLRLINIAVAVLTGWSMVWMNFISVIFSGGIYGLVLFQLVRSKERISLGSIMILMPTIALIVFSMRSNIAWIWDNGVVFFGSLFFCIFGFFILSFLKFKWIKYWAVLPLGVLATFSFSTGLIFWPIGFFLLLFHNYEGAKTKKRALCLWVIITIVVVYLFLQDYVAPPSDVLPAMSWGRLQDYTMFVLVYLGSLVENSAAALFFGLLGLVAFLLLNYFIYSDKLIKKRGVAFFLALGYFSILCALLTGVGRSYRGVLHALSFHYVIFSYPFWISIITLTFCFMDRRQNRHFVLRKALPIGMFAFVFFILKTSIATFPTIKYESKFYNEAGLELVEFKDKEMLQRLYPRMDWLKIQRDRLKKHKLTIFRK